MYFYILQSSPFGSFGLVWRDTEDGPKVFKVFLPQHEEAVEGNVRAMFPEAVQRSCHKIGELGDRIQSFLEGKPVGFGIEMIAREVCSGFQKRVLLAEYKVPRGWVTTYGRIARRLGVPGGARAVGGALANNPFPILIPCHRAIQSDGGMGGFQGGVEMKRALLEMEGVEFSRTGKVITNRIYY